jgi:monovalent cation:H+ antiporter, CPA1 family
MILTLPALLAIFTLLAISSGVYLLAEKIKVSYTVLLVATGTFLLVPLSLLPPFSFLRSFSLTPEILLYVFLPVLIFESAYHINIRDLFKNSTAITTISILSLLISTFTIGFLLYFILPFFGFPLPFLLCLLFGSLISATDPVAVLSLFKEVGAPRRLTLLFEGESIFNDGTAVALFLVILAIIAGGWHGSETFFFAVGSFLFMVFGGILLGAFLGILFTKAIEIARLNEFVQIALMVVLAHFTFLFSDYISEYLNAIGHHLHISAIISTAIASIIVGNYGKAKILPHAQDFVEKFWAESAFLANSLVFILIGLIFVNIPFSLTFFIIPILISVLAVAFARAFSIYPVLFLLNKIGREEKIPTSWHHLLAWGSLRGALALTMALLIPNELSFPHWTLLASPKETILALTLGCIFATLFIKALTIKKLMRYLNIGNFSDLEHLAYKEVRALIELRALSRIQKFKEKGFIDTNTADILLKEHKKELQNFCTECAESMGKDENALGERVLRLYAIGVEKDMLDTLYDFGEVNEKTYRRVLSKLSLQYEYIEKGLPINPSLDANQEDVFYRLHSYFYKKIFPKREENTYEDKYLYYRTQSILSRTALRTLKKLDTSLSGVVFGTCAEKNIRSVYEKFLEGSNEKLNSIVKEKPKETALLAERFARHAILETEMKTLKELFLHQMMTPKVYITAKNALEKRAEKHKEKNIVYRRNK